MRGQYWAVVAFLSTAAAGEFRVTSIGARDGRSTLECWQLDIPINVSNQAGTAGVTFAELGDVANISYSVIPPHYDAGLHNAPHNQWVVFLSGLAHITLPGCDTTSTDCPNNSVSVSGGQFGVIFAADIAEKSVQGHRTQYPGTVDTIALQIPVKDGQIPRHVTLHDGPCEKQELTSLSTA